MSKITEALKRVVDKDDVKEAESPGTDLSPIDMIASKSLIDVVEKGAFAGLSDEQRQSATFRTGSVVAASAFELGKAFDPNIDQKEAYIRGAAGLISIFEIAFSAKRVLDGLQMQDDRSRRSRESSLDRVLDSHRREMHDDTEKE